VNRFVAEIVRGDGPVRATGVANPREGSWIVGDVRLDGRDELRDSLGAAGVATERGSSDTALVLAAWTAWRETATERLRGDFSFALWDHRDRCLFCARDPLGVRPLFWAQPGGAFVCANTLDALRAHGRVSSRLHEPAIVSFLRWGFNADVSTTSFADVRRLPPAHQLVVRDDSRALTSRRYWSFPVPEPLRLTRDDEYVECYRDVLGAAVRDRLRVDHAAILLSGGLDSTSLAATARRVSPQVSLRAWTSDVGPSAPEDEVRLASSVASRLGLAHEVIRDDSRPLSHLDDPGFNTPEPLDEPAWDSWIRQLRRIASDAQTLVVGEDGDALFRPPGLLTMLRSWPATDVMRRVIAYTISHRRHPHLGIWLRRRLAAPFHRRTDRAPAWIRREVLARAGDAHAPGAAAHPTRPDAVRYLDHPVWQCVLESAQPAYTGVELEMVWPFLDTRVIEFVFSIPPVPWCQRKELVRRAFRGELPGEILERPKSPLHGFAERQVAMWRESRRPEATAIGDEVREFVDSRRVADTLENGSFGDVSAAWRVLALDHWIRDLRGRERSGIT
jgi:asparagine synthase (glutamine-hydrolysing)